MLQKHSLITNAIHYLLGLGIVTFLLIKLDVSRMLNAIIQADFSWVFAGLLAIAFIRVFSSWQNWLALDYYDINLSLARILVINTIVGFYSLFLPSAATGAIKWVKFSKSHGKYPEVLASLLFIKAINTIFICFIGSFALLTSTEFRQPAISFFAVSLLGALIAFYVCLFVFPLHKKTENWLESHLNWLPDKLLCKINELFQAVSISRQLQRKVFLRILLVPILLQVMLFLLFFAVACALNLYLPASVLIWIGSMVYLIHLVPASISGLGLREGALVVLLPYYQVEPADALAFSLIIFSFTVFLGGIGGVLEAVEVYAGWKVGENEF
jgi:uncharacterized membrane protein YbhN (UPF0104 family)